MKLKLCFSLCIALLAALASDAALARSRAYVGVYMGPPPVYVGPPSMFWGPGWYPSPWYYPPQVVVVPQAPLPPPPVYIEQREAPPEQFWYYCGPSRAYYPHVKDCPEPWQRVLPQSEQR